MRLGAVRRFAAIARATALEIISEPLSLLLLTAALSLAVFAPAFHYHQFGEPSRMARDAGLSALLLGGTLISVVGAVRSVRREFEGGTAAVALSHPVSLPQFLFAKAFGAYVAFALFALAVGAVTATIVNGAEIGARIARKTGDIPRLWGPCYACGVAAIVLPYVIGAVLNRFRRVRFARVAFLLTVVLALASLACRPDFAALPRLAPAVVLLWIAPVFFVTAAVAAAARFRTNAAAAILALLVAGFLPFAGNYCLSEALAKGGTIPWRYVLAAALAALPAVLAAFLAILLQSRREFGS